MIGFSRPLIRAALGNPGVALFVLSFITMSAVVSIEMVEKWPYAHEWMRLHGRSVAIVKQVLCMIALPGFLIAFFASFRGEARRLLASGPKPRWSVVVLGVAAAALLIYFVWRTAFAPSSEAAT